MKTLKSTGLKDKTGRTIHERDFIKHPELHGEVEHIVYKHNQFWGITDYVRNNLDKVKIMGNSHEMTHWHNDEPAVREQQD